MQINLHDKIVLELVNASNLETLRNIRNNAIIQNTLVAKGVITEREQLSWFNQLNHRECAYFLIKINQQVKGYCLIKNINQQLRAGEPGIFLTEHHNSTLGGLLTIAFLDFLNDFFGIDYFFGNVLQSNKTALNNYSFYFTEKINDENGEIILKSASKYNAMNRINNIRSFLQKTENYQRIFNLKEFNVPTEFPPYYLKENIFVLD